MGKMRAHPRVPGCSNEVVGLRGPGGAAGAAGAGGSAEALQREAEAVR